MATTVNCCWNKPQNAADAMNRGMKDSTRLRSVRSTLGLVRSSAK
jgi:hypothetical protein